MSIRLSDLNVLACANNFTMWHYKSGSDDPRTKEYFNSACDMMNKNDLIICMTDNFKGILIVHENEKSIVTVKEFI